MKDASFKPTQRELLEVVKRATDSIAAWEQQKSAFAAEVTKMMNVLAPYGKIGFWCTGFGTCIAVHFRNENCLVIMIFAVKKES